MPNKIKIILLILVLVSLFFFETNFTLAQDENDLIIEFENTPLFSQANFLPGKSITRWVKAENHSELDQTLGVELLNYYDPDGLGDWLDLEIKQNSNTLHAGTLADLAQAGEISLGNINNNQTIQYNFTATFSSRANNNFQGKTLTFDIVLGYIDSGDDGGDDNNGGGGGYVPAYQGELRYIYPMGKLNRSEVLEWVTLYNKSRNVLYPGTIKIDVPEEYLKFASADPAWDSLNQATGQATWSTPLLTANDAFHILFKIETLQAGNNLLTQVYFDNQHVHLYESGRETIKQNVTEQEKNKWSFDDNPQGGGLVLGESDITSANSPANQIDTDNNSSLNSASQPDNYLVQAMLGDYQPSDSQQVLGSRDYSADENLDRNSVWQKNGFFYNFKNLSELLKESASCAWWLWLVIAALYTLLAFVYNYLVIKRKWLGLLVVIIILVPIYILSSLKCGTPKVFILSLVVVHFVSLVFMARYYIENLLTSIKKVRHNLKVELNIITYSISLAVFILQLMFNLVF